MLIEVVKEIQGYGSVGVDKIASPLSCNFVFNRTAPVSKKPITSSSPSERESVFGTSNTYTPFSSVSGMPGREVQLPPVPPVFKRQGV